MFVLTLFAGLRPHGLPRALTLAAVIGFAALFLARTAVLSVAWHGHVDDLAQLRATMAAVAPGDKVYLASVAPNEMPDYWAKAPLARRLSNGIRADTHLPALLTMERRAFWPMLFDQPSQQPVLLTPAFQALAERNAGLMDHLAIVPSTLCGFDWVFLLGAGGDPGFTTPNLRLQATSDAAALYRIRPETLTCR